jgi:hypothetical protein
MNAQQVPQYARVPDKIKFCAKKFPNFLPGTLAYETLRELFMSSGLEESVDKAVTPTTKMTFRRNKPISRQVGLFHSLNLR